MKERPFRVTVTGPQHGMFTDALAAEFSPAEMSAVSIALEHAADLIMEPGKSKELRDGITKINAMLKGTGATI